MSTLIIFSYYDIILINKCNLFIEKEESLKIKTGINRGNMKEFKNPFAYDMNNNMIMIKTRDYDNKNLYQNCHCPICNEILVAKMGEKNLWHFAHSKNSNCKNSFETSLHQYAKKVFENNSELLLPEINLGESLSMNMFDKNLVEDIALWLDYNDWTTECYTTIFEANKYKYTWIFNECKFDSFIPDILIMINEKKVAVEIYVTHSVDEVKRKKVYKSNIDMIEIYLNPKEITKKLNEDNFDLDYYILYEAPREWILKTGSPYFNKIIINKIYNTRKCIVNEKYTQQVLVERSKYFLKCPMCNGSLVLRNGKNGKFYSCSKYPKCKFSKKRLYDIGCPKCGKKLDFLEGKYGMFLGHYFDSFNNDRCEYRRSLKKYEEFLLK